MSERDRKQIVSEVCVGIVLPQFLSHLTVTLSNSNILKDLHHEHIVRYHDRHVDRDAGILYILMEYCGGGDLSSVIKQAQRQNRPIPEDTVWNYFMQILPPSTTVIIRTGTVALAVALGQMMGGSGGHRFCTVI